MIHREPLNPWTTPEKNMVNKFIAISVETFHMLVYFSQMDCRAKWDYDAAPSTNCNIVLVLSLCF